MYDAFVIQDDHVYFFLSYSYKDSPKYSVFSALPILQKLLEKFPHETFTLNFETSSFEIAGLPKNELLIVERSVTAKDTDVFAPFVDIVDSNGGMLRSGATLGPKLARIKEGIVNNCKFFYFI